MIKKGEPKQTRTDVHLLSSLAPHRYALGQEMLYLWSCHYHCQTSLVLSLSDILYLWPCHCHTCCIFGPVTVTHAVSLALSLSHMLYLWPCHCHTCCIFGPVTVTHAVSLDLSLSHILYLCFFHCQTSFSIFDLVTVRHRSVPLVLSVRPIVLYLKSCRCQTSFCMFGLVLSPSDIQTHKRFKRTLFIRTRQNQQKFGISHVVKLQNNT